MVCDTISVQIFEEDKFISKSQKARMHKHKLLYDELY